MNGSTQSAAGLRSLLQRHPRVVTACAIVVLLICGAVVARSAIGPSRQRGDVYYFNVQTGELFTDQGGQVTPIAASTDPADAAAGVFAHVFGCGNCDNEAARYIAWISKHNEALVAELREKHDGDLPPEALRTLDLSARGTLVRSPLGGPETPWFTAGSPEGAQIVQAGLDECDGRGSPVPCVP